MWNLKNEWTSKKQKDTQYRVVAKGDRTGENEWKSWGRFGGVHLQLQKKCDVSQEWNPQGGWNSEYYGNNFVWWQMASRFVMLIIL